MLVLTRRVSEKLFIGDDICVTIVRVSSSQVRLGIEAPRDVAVVRSELRTPGAKRRAGTLHSQRSAHLKNQPVPGRSDRKR